MITRNRKCIKCSKDFVLKENEKSSNICYKCRRDYQKAYARKIVEELPEDERYKAPYPYSDNERLKRFSDRRKLLHNMEDRNQWREFYKERLDYMEENEKEILVWIYDRRDQESKSKDALPKVKAEYENERKLNENKSWFDV